MNLVNDGSSEDANDWVSHKTKSPAPMKRVPKKWNYLLKLLDLVKKDAILEIKETFPSAEETYIAEVKNLIKKRYRVTQHLCGSNVFCFGGLEAQYGSKPVIISAEQYIELIIQSGDFLSNKSFKFLEKISKQILEDQDKTPVDRPDMF